MPFAYPACFAPLSPLHLAFPGLVFAEHSFTRALMCAKHATLICDNGMTNIERAHKLSYTCTTFKKVCVFIFMNVTLLTNRF